MTADLLTKDTAVSPGEDDVRQHGELRFRLANLCENMELFEAAVAAAKEAQS